MLLFFTNHQRCLGSILTHGPGHHITLEVYMHTWQTANFNVNTCSGPVPLIFGMPPLITQPCLLAGAIFRNRVPETTVVILDTAWGLAPVFSDYLAQGLLWRVNGIRTETLTICEVDLTVCVVVWSQTQPCVTHLDLPRFSLTCIK